MGDASQGRPQDTSVSGIFSLDRFYFGETMSSVAIPYSVLQKLIADPAALVRPLLGM
jgi:hypothetical protein